METMKNRDAEKGSDDRRSQKVKWICLPPSFLHGTNATPSFFVWKRRNRPIGATIFRWCHLIISVTKCESIVCQ